ncbi:DUF4390 domain-containing protein [Gemmatimonadota bacterium]
MTRTLSYILIASLLAPVTVFAQEGETVITVGAVWLEADELFFSVETVNLLEESARQTIQEGGTAAVDYTYELYRQRKGWFDSLIDSGQLQFRISFDAFERQYRVISPDMRLKTDDFNKVISQCTELNTVSFSNTDRSRLDMQGTYYIVVRVRYQPMSVETINDLREWVGGSGGSEEGNARENRGEGLGARIAQVLMSAAGFGEEDLQGESNRFRPSELEIRIPPGIN